MRSPRSWGDTREGLLTLCEKVETSHTATPVSLGYPLSVFNKNSTLYSHTVCEKSERCLRQKYLNAIMRSPRSRGEIQEGRLGVRTREILTPCFNSLIHPHTLISRVASETLQNLETETLGSKPTPESQESRSETKDAPRVHRSSMGWLRCVGSIK